jgi:hypothetical protein
MWEMELEPGVEEWLDTISFKVERARTAMRRCIAEGHTAEED